MRFVLPVFAKLNLTLRVTGRRPDGYHELMSAFMRIPSGESLFVAPGVDADSVEMRGLDLKFDGENIVSKALRLARNAGADIPPLRVEIAKALYPGSGLGTGSGNAGAILRWLAPGYPALPWADVARRTGSDVTFLFSGLQMARVSGIGERLEPLAPLNLGGCVVFPDWDVGTESAYAALDAAYPGGYPLNEAEAREEMSRTLQALESGRRTGLLPNNFLPPLVEAHPQYRGLFDLMDDAGALAWGITGSGGAAFALFAGASPGGGGHVPALSWPAWARQVLFF